MFVCTVSQAKESETCVSLQWKPNSEQSLHPQFSRWKNIFLPTKYFGSFRENRALWLAGWWVGCRFGFGSDGNLRRDPPLVQFEGRWFGLVWFWFRRKPSTTPLGSIWGTLLCWPNTDNAPVLRKRKRLSIPDVQKYISLCGLSLFSMCNKSWILQFDFFFDFRQVFSVIAKTNPHWPKMLRLVIFDLYLES